MLLLLQFLFDHSEFFTGETRHIVPPCNEAGISDKAKISGAKNCQPVQNPLTLYCPPAYPPPILSHPMHTLPLLYPTPRIPSPYFIPLQHTLPLLYPTPAHPPPIRSHTAMLALPLFYRSPCTLSPYSIPPYACPIFILSHPMLALSLFYPTLCMSSPSPHKPPQNSILFQPVHVLLTPCHIQIEGMSFSHSTLILSMKMTV